MSEVVESVDDGGDLCIHCLESVGHNAVFCIHCRAPLNFLAGVVPYYSVFAEGFILRTAVCNPKNLTTLLGVWFVFGNYLLMGLSLLWVSLSGNYGLTRDWVDFYFMAVYGGMGAIGLAGVIRGTYNYTKNRPVRAGE